jgi:flagellar hook-associated protein 2
VPELQFTGVTSGLDTKAIIGALMGGERMPLVRLQSRATQLTSRRSALGTLGTAVRDLLAKAQGFTLTSAGSARSATSADLTRFTAIAGSTAVPGQYKVSVDRLATATKATSTAALGTAITDATATGFMSALPLPGTVTAGQVGIVVDGTIVNATVGAPATTSLKTAIDAMAAALQTQIQTTDAGATVIASIVANEVRFTVAGAASAHDIHFGVGGDTSNALTIFGLAGQHIANFGTGVATISGSSLLGVTQGSVALDSAGLTGLTSTATGVLTINGTAIAYDTTTESLNAILTRINNSDAGVVASVDRTNDKIVLARRAAGATAIAISDTSGTLGAALKLAPGTTNAQVIGQTAQVTIDGTRVVTSDTNTVTTAIDGVTLTLLDTTVSQTTLTVGVDSTAIQKSLTDLVNSYNGLADTIDKLTTHAKGAAAAPLEGDSSVRSLALSMRTLLMGISASMSGGTLRSLGDLGVSSGAVGAKPGSTTRLSLDATKLAAVLASNPTGVASLLGTSGGIMTAVVDRLKTATAVDGMIVAGQAAIDTELQANTDAQARLQTRIDLRQKGLERKFAALEVALSKLQSQQAQVGAQVTSFYNNNSR